MSHDLKRRLIGASVLISLAIIFLPMILEHKPLLVDRGQMTGIPKAPEEKFQSDLISAEMAEENTQPVAAVTSSEPQQPEPVPVSAPAVSETPQVAVAKPVTETRPEPVIVKPEPKPAPVPVISNPPKQPSKTASGPSAWVIQVGSFSNQDNAKKLVQRLRKAGLDTMDPLPATVNGKQLYRVKVGPELDKRNAEKLLPKVKKVAGLQGTVIRYP